MLELVWQQDATASLFTRASDGTISAARSLDVRGLLRLAETPPADAGGSAAAAFAVVELAHRSVTEGLVHPYLEHDAGSWHAFWGATLDGSVQAALDEIASALPEAAAAAFDGDRDAVVHDLYPVLVDQIARDRLQAGRVRLGATLRNGRPTALELFLDGLSASEPELPRHAGYAALNRRLSRWLDDGLGRRSSRSVEARPPPGRARDGTRARALAARRGRPDPRRCRPRSCTSRATRSSASSARAIRTATSPGS